MDTTQDLLEMDTTQDLLEMARHNLLRVGNPGTGEVIVAQAQAYLLMAIAQELKRANDAKEQKDFFG